MKRKLVMLTISYIIGIIWGLYFNKNMAPFLFIIFAICFFISRKKYSILLVSTTIIACIYTANVKYKYDTKYIDVNECKIVGTIIKEYKQDDSLKLYVIKVDSIDGDKSYKGTRLLVREKIVNNGKSNYGNLISIEGTVEIPEKSRNYKGFNYNESLRSQKIYATVITKSSDIKILKEKNLNEYSVFLNKIHKKINKNLYNILPYNTADMCAAIMLGDKENLDENTVDIFSKSDLSHVLAISGMHMGYIVMIVSLVFSRVGKRNQKVSIIIISLLFCNLVGNGNSVIRACIMIIMLKSGELLHKKADSLTNLSIACMFILLENPYAIKNLSFILSFVATLGIITFYKPLDKKFENIFNNNKIMIYLKKTVILSISANILLIPINAVLFNKISFIFIISNICATIILSVLMPAVMLCIVISFFSLFLAKFVGYFVNILVSIFLYISKLTSQMTFLEIVVTTPSIYSMIFYYLIVVASFMTLKKVKKQLVIKCVKYVITIYVCICVMCRLYKNLDNNLYIHLVDVGQGDCTFIVTPGKKTILIDGGGAEKNDYVGKNVLVPYLLDRGFKRINYVIISHFDTDHVGRNTYCYARIKGRYCCYF